MDRNLIEMNRPGRERLFYSVCAAVLLIVMGIGFLPFYANGKAYGGHDLPRPIYTLTILHGVGMTAWALLFQLQTSLIARGCRHFTNVWAKPVLYWRYSWYSWDYEWRSHQR